MKKMVFQLCDLSYVRLTNYIADSVSFVLQFPCPLLTSVGCVIL